jgi:hypothetical protein
MASLDEAFNGNFDTKDFQSIDYFFTQRSIKEENEYFDKNLNRYKKKTDKLHNFLAIIVPYYKISDDKTSSIDINIWGNSGYYFNGKIISSEGSTPSFIIPIKEDKQLFVNLNYKEINKDNKENNINRYTRFIEVPKRFQTVSIDKLNETEVQI